MSEHISEILQRDLVVSTKRGEFSTPAEITEHVNALLDADYSTRRISVELQSLGWQRCGSNRAKRNGRTCGYYFKGNRKGKALLSPIANTQSKSKSKEASSEDESLASIDRRFKHARASKEQNLSDIRKVEVKTASHRETHLRLQFEKERKELIPIEEVTKGWETALVTLKNELYALPLKLSGRFASLNDEGKIHDDFIQELDNMCNRLNRAEEEATVAEKDRLKNV